MSIHTHVFPPNDTSQEHISHKKNENARKRPRDDDNDQCDIDRRPFTVQPNASDPFARPRVFTPICLLTRAQLPLAYLDTSQDGSRLLTAHIQILEACHEHGTETNVLIVDDEKDGRFYAIERTQRRQYALCRIGGWVKREELEERSRIMIRTSGPQAKRQALRAGNESHAWWMAATALALPEVRPVKRPDAPTLAMRLERSENTITTSGDNHHPGAAMSEATNPTVDIQDLAVKPTSPEEALEELTKQYLDALYVSRTPIAYFVKGPLARVRAALSQSTELVSFLRGAILSCAVMEKKYRESIPTIIKELPVLETPDAKPKARRKRKWKPKRDKSGNFVDEKDYVEQWWRKDDTGYIAPSPGETMDAAIKRRSPKLRNREIFLQVVLILEVMALEAALPQDAAPADTATESQVAPLDKKPRKKKELDLASILDEIIDKLSIWYTLEGTSPAKNSGDDKLSSEIVSDDLKSFASDVIIPFYGARIPDSAYATSKKFGGPTAPTPAKRQPASSHRRPGEPAPRNAPEKRPRRPLERVSTDTLNQVGKRPPSLPRSATDIVPLAPLIKREVSEAPSLEAIPWAKQRSQQPAQTGARRGVSSLGLLNRRELDLSAMSQANEAKKQKRAAIDEKLLRESISNIKKPNRQRALEDAAKEVDESFAKAISKGRSSNTAQPRTKGRERHASAITATPGHIKATPAPRRRLDSRLDHSRDSGEASIVPSSSARLKMQYDEEVPGSTFAVPQTGHRTRIASKIDDTPSRGFAKFMPMQLTRAPGTLLESPTATRSTPIFQTPSKRLTMAALSETPMKKISSTPTSKSQGVTNSSLMSLSGADPTTSAEAQRHEPRTTPKDVSVYDALGWNDYEPLS